MESDKKKISQETKRGKKRGRGEGKRREEGEEGEKGGGGEGGIRKKKKGNEGIHLHKKQNHKKQQ